MKYGRPSGGMATIVHQPGPGAPPQLSIPVEGVLIDADPEATPVSEICEAPRPVEGKDQDPLLENNQYEYEGILMQCEMTAVDFVDGLCRRICPCKPPKREENPDFVPGTQICSAGDVSNPEIPVSAHKERRNRYLWWEGLREDVPERYQRWEGIRERNVILSLAMRMCGHGRKQPTLVERVNLFLIYASAWYLVYGFMLRRRGDICRKAWVDTCVPTDFGGGCVSRESTCASEDLLARTPRGFDDYRGISKSTRVEMDTSKSWCVEEGLVDDICELPMCSRHESGCADMSQDDGISGFCNCDPIQERLPIEVLSYTIAMKVLYLPFWYTFVLDLEAASKRCHQVVLFLAMLFHTMLFLCGAVVIWSEVNQWQGWGWETGQWFVTFIILCLFEVVKSFTLGFVVGSYIIEPLCCKHVARVWKFLLA